jgi:hypothetical protein
MHTQRANLVRRIWLVAAVCGSSVGLTLADYSLDWYTIDGGGDMWSAGDDLELSGTIGQPDAGCVMTGGTFELVGGFWSLPPGPQLSRGDLNCDGAVNGYDIDPFVLALTSPTEYATVYPSCNILNADTNCDGAVNGYDIDPFVACLTGGCEPCP